MPDLERFLRRSAPVWPAPPAGLEADILAALGLEDAAAARSVARPRGRPVRRRLAVALAGAALLAGGSGALLEVLDRGGGSAWAAPLVRAAEGSPRLLLEGEGWTVTRADELRGGTGETVFARGGASFQLNWQSARLHPIYVRDRRGGQDLVRRTEVLGSPALVFRYERSDRYEALWRDARFSLYLSGHAPDLDAFLGVLGALRPAGVDEWLSAMPASAVRPSARTEVVEAMLRDVPLPPGFALDALRRGDETVRDRYQLGAEVAGTVACAWIGRWLDARRTGDEPAAGEAVAAMASSREWAVLREMDREGDYPEVLWRYADAMAGVPVVVGGSIEATYARSLGCRPPEGGRP